MLVYDQPINQAKPGERAATRAPSEFDLLALFGVLWQRRSMIIASAFIAACLAVAAGNAIVADPQAMIEAADRAGLFVTGMSA